MSGASEQPGISVVIPVFNSAAGISALLERLESVLTGLGQPFEVVLVDDSSEDTSWEAIVRCAEARPWLRGFRLMRNYGQHNALLCGIRVARYAICVTLDDDLQNPPEEIPALLSRLAEGYDLVYGVPVSVRHARGHRLASAMLKLALAMALGAKTARDVSPQRAFRTRLRRAFADVRTPWVILDILLTWATTRIATVPVRHDRRPYGRTTYTFRRRFVQALDLITGFSTLPLKIASVVGFVFTLFGFGVLCYVIVIYFLYGGIPGFPFLASTIAIFSGAQLFALGVVGEYLARMFQRIMDRPTYTVGDTTERQGDAETQQRAVRAPTIP